MIQYDKVEYAYNQGKNVVNGVTLEIKKGEFVAVIGHNGSGKSTLAKLTNALFLPTAGKVLVEKGAAVLVVMEEVEVPKTVTVIQVASRPSDDMSTTRVCHSAAAVKANGPTEVQSAATLLNSIVRS